jgi:hypothetical protein
MDYFIKKLGFAFGMSVSVAVICLALQWLLGFGSDSTWPYLCGGITFLVFLMLWQFERFFYLLGAAIWTVLIVLGLYSLLSHPSGDSWFYFFSLLIIGGGSALFLWWIAFQFFPNKPFDKYPPSQPLPSNPVTYRVCPYCFGSGKVPAHIHGPDKPRSFILLSVSKKRCDPCEGTGYLKGAYSQYNSR